MHGRTMNPETNDQFLARMIICTREGHQVASLDSQRLADLANGMNSVKLPTQPEERRPSTSVTSKPALRELIVD